MKRKIKAYTHSIYFIDIIVVAVITLMLFSILGDYAQVNRVQHQLAVQEIRENTNELINLSIIKISFLKSLIIFHWININIADLFLGGY